MATKKTTAAEATKGGIEITKDSNTMNLILPEDVASAIWNDWKPGTVNVCIGSPDNIAGIGTFNRIGNRAAFYFQKVEKGDA